MILSMLLSLLSMMLSLLSIVVVLVAIVVVAVVVIIVVNPNTNSLNSYALHCGAINSFKRVLLCVKVM